MRRLVTRVRRWSPPSCGRVPGSVTSTRCPASWRSSSSRSRSLRRSRIALSSALLGLVDASPRLAALVGRQSAERLELARQLALLAEPADAHVLQLGGVGRVPDGAQSLVHHRRVPTLPCPAGVRPTFPWAAAWRPARGASGGARAKQSHHPSGQWPVCAELRDSALASEHGSRRASHAGESSPARRVCQRGPRAAPGVVRRRYTNSCAPHVAPLHSCQAGRPRPRRGVRRRLAG